MLQLFISSTRSAARPIPTGKPCVALPSDAMRSAADQGVSDGMPFFLDHKGHYQEELNAFLRACPTMGVRSLNSLKAYALDISVWARFLEERRVGKDLWQADRHDLAAYHAARRRSAASYRVSASTWNRSIASLEKLYDWALEEGVCKTSPLGRAVTSRWYPSRWRPVRSVRAREPGARRGNVRIVDLPRYIEFRDVGLRGVGDSDRDRNGERNALFAEVLVTTGLRLEEATSLLVAEVMGLEQRRSAGAQRSLPLRIAAGTAKGNKGREIRLPVRLLRRLIDYIGLERAHALRLRSFGRRKEPDQALILLDHDHERIQIPGEGRPRWISLDSLSSRERRHLVLGHRDGPPACLWLSERGEPMTGAAWEAVFRRASERCRARGIEIAISPHTLRHIFATNMLAMLIREQIGQTVRYRRGEASGAAAYRRMIGDPLRTLQGLLGHASIASTHIYLDTLEESRALIEAATDRWASMVGEPSGT